MNISPVLFSGLAIFFYIIFFIAFIVAWGNIFLKAGLSRWYCFLMAVPIVNILLFFIFAFAKWPIHEFISDDWQIKKLDREKQRLEREKEKIEEKITTQKGGEATQ